MGLPDSKGPEARRFPRQRVMLSATVRQADNITTWSCTVRNISEDGARLSLPNAYLIPKSFNLDVPSRDLRRPCTVVWRSENELGVHMDGKTPTETRSIADQIAELRKERESLLRRLDSLTR
jgi:hypothetical protein